jgi:hypothetical protein
MNRPLRHVPTPACEAGSWPRRPGGVWSKESNDEYRFACRRTLANEYIKRRFDDLKEEAQKFADAAKVPALKRKLTKKLADSPAQPWDEAVASFAAEAAADQDDLAC